MNHILTVMDFSVTGIFIHELPWEETQSKYNGDIEDHVQAFLDENKYRRSEVEWMISEPGILEINNYTNEDVFNQNKAVSDSEGK